MRTQPPAGTDLRLAELIAALSLATDLGTGLPLGQALRTCLLATRFAEALGLDEGECRDVYYVALLRSVGCVATARELAPFFYDEIAFNGEMYARDKARPGEIMPVVVRHAGAGRSGFERARTVARFMAEGSKGADRVFAADCEVARLLAARLGMPEAVVTGVGQVFERWDGKGAPNHLAGEAIARSARIVVIATTADL